MTLKRFFVVLVLLSFCFVFAGCGNGTSPSSAGGTSSDGSGINIGGDTGSGQPSKTGTTLSWDAPTTNEDGTPLADLAGYKIYYGSSSGSYTGSVTAGAVTNYVLTDLTPGAYYIAVTAYNSSGDESGYSNEVSKAVL
jgi:hypothetical protein